MMGMLTQQDLDAIGNLIDKKLDEKLDKKFKEELKPINSKLTNLHKEMIQFRKDLNMVVKFFDNDITGVRRRVDRLEDYLHLSS